MAWASSGDRQISPSRATISWRRELSGGEGSWRRELSGGEGSGAAGRW